MSLHLCVKVGSAIIGQSEGFGELRCMSRFSCHDRQKALFAHVSLSAERILGVDTMKYVLLFFSTACTALFAAPDGAQLFTNNCSACHVMDQMVVGPSLAEIRGLYLGKPDDFVKWSVAPKKKRPHAIEMPSMVHVGDEGLRAIYEHVMKVAEGVKEKKQDPGDPYKASATYTARPQVQRIFMPNAGPAAIALALDATNSLCWDAGECRLRYAWTGGFIDGFPYWRGNGSGLASLVGTVKYTEAQSPFGAGKDVKFLGYTMKDKLPTFRYQIGAQTVMERFTPLKEGTGFQRTFAVTPTPAAPLTLEFNAQDGVTITCDQGTMKGTKLTLASADAATFTLTFSLK
jgi:cytochrome c551/c552